MRLLLGDCVEVMQSLDESSIDAIVTDPPYELGFMGKTWDRSGVTYRVETWTESLRVLKPGGHLLAFGGSRTFHRLVCAVEDAGFEIRDTLSWLYGSGFPKSLDVSKAIDRQRDDYEAVRLVVEFVRVAAKHKGENATSIASALGWGEAVVAHFLAPSRSNAGCPQWEQWLSLKAYLGFGDEMDAEVWRLNGRKGKPGENWDKRELIGSKAVSRILMDSGDLVGGVVRSGEIDVTAPATDAAKQWDGWGTALKPAHEPIVLARKPLSEKNVASNVLRWNTGALNIDGTRINPGESVPGGGNGKGNYRYGDSGNYTSDRGKVSPHNAGRWPANLLLGCACENGQEGDHDPDCAVRMLDEQSGERVSGWKDTDKPNGAKSIFAGANHTSRHFSDRGGASRFFYTAKSSRRERGEGNDHPTVKPVALMRYLCRLITPPGGTVLDPFMGSGTTGIAAQAEGFEFVGIEKDPHYFEIAQKRTGQTLELAAR